MSCEGFLDEIPISNETTKSFFNTSEDFEQILNSSYRSLQGIADNRIGTTGAYWAMSEMRSDNTTFQYNTTDQSGHRFWSLNNFTLSAQDEITHNIWTSSYDGIGKCNNLIQYSEGVEYENKDRYIAEAKFLRGLYYAYLVRYFGDVPLVTKSAGAYEEAFENNKRVPKEQVYEQIFKDLNEAKNVLPATYSSDNAGRATSGAARLLLAKEYMWNGMYGEAKMELEAIVNSPENPYKLLDSYAEVFEGGIPNTKEIVFSVQFIAGTYDLHSTFMYCFLPWNSETELLPLGQITARTGMNIPTTDLINSFEKGDERLSMIDTSYIDHGFATYHDSIVPYTKKYHDAGHAVQTQTGTNFPLFRYPHVLLMLAECYVREGGGDADELVNEVRRRAGLSPMQNVTLDDIIHERRIEFHCEADRWDVLVRTGQAEEVMKAHGVREKALRPGAVIPENAFTKIKLLYPIPSFVLQTDATMEQNSEYK